MKHAALFEKFLKNLSHPSRVRGLKRRKKIVSLTEAKSHPSRVRGLKRDKKQRTARNLKVAPFTGAWIETLSLFLLSTTRKSHPSRVRGLKPSNFTINVEKNRSHPSRVRGLKHLSSKKALHHLSVAPFTGAWIETSIVDENKGASNCRTLHGCVD